MASPVLVWFRRDLRLSDHAALTAAVAQGGPVIPVFVCDELVTGLGAAPKWRMGLGIQTFEKALRAKESQLTLRAGDARDVIPKLVQETGAKTVYWQRAYDPKSVARDTDVKIALKDLGVDAQSFAGHLMFEPWSAQTKQGGFYKVYTPFWKSVRNRVVPAPLKAPAKIPAPVDWPASDILESWSLGGAMNRGAAIVRPFVRLGEAAAQARLEKFVASNISEYHVSRDIPGVDGTSNLSENLSLGEISPSQCWHAGHRALLDGRSGAETFLKELVWREFAYHLMWHTPRILTDNWREGWASFPWNENESREDVLAWKQGRTGIRFVDAAMREMYVTGRMHNRGRMIVASYLTKHLMCHWKIGMSWFEDCLTDWDPAANAMGWQWSAGSGPDATPYFRVFNPVTQLEKFDKDRKYASRWIAEGLDEPHHDALSFFRAVPKSWDLSASNAYPKAIVTPEEGRQRALAAYADRDF